MVALDDVLVLADMQNLQKWVRWLAAPVFSGMDGWMPAAGP
jgi:hypothetical protein